MTIKDQKSLSSISGRRWLKNTSVAEQVQEGLSNTEVPEQPSPLQIPETVRLKREQMSPVETIVVDVPDMSSLHSVAIPPFNYSRVNAEEAGLGVASDSVVDNDLSEKAADWTGTDQNQATPRTSAPPEPKPENTDPKDSAVDVLCDAILERFPVGESAVILFAGSEPNIHVDETTARVASRLAGRDLGKVLLVDSDLKTRALSLASGLAKEQGILDVKERNKDWKPLVYNGASSRLDFMPAGIGFKYCDPKKKADLIKAVAEMKLEYQFVLVSVGDAHSVPAHVWSDICDGSYLLVSMKKSNQTIAQSAVAEMKTCGARLLGCVVTDAD